MRTKWLNVLVLTALLLGLFPFSVSAAPVVESPVIVEVESELQNQLQADGSTGYLIYFVEQADLSPAYNMDWQARGRFVAKALQETAERSQRQVRAYLDLQGAQYQAFWIDNVIVVEKSSRNTFNALTTAFPEIEALRARRQPMLHEPEDIAPLLASLAIEPNISHVNADDVWGMGYNGQGIIVANIDTGVRYSHDALVNQYRGNLGGGTFDHNYSWWDPYVGTAAPVDVHNHGSHTMGTMIGDDGGANQIGMAPAAQWIACKGFNPGATDAGLLSCGQFMAAPWDLAGANADPDLRPHVVNNSWGDCGTTYDPWYDGVLTAWHAAGVYPVFSNGNAGNCGYSSPPGLNTVGNPARSGSVTGVGSTGTSNGAYATHSNWGPTDNPDTINPRGYPNLKPQVLAPGTNRSAYMGSDSTYGGMTGTSMSAPHVVGLIALMWSAAPCLIGDYATTETIIEETATPIPYASGGSPPPGPGNVPNYATGWGEINALAAVEAAIASCGDSVLNGTVTDAATTAPIQSARVEATDGITQTMVRLTDVNGFYALNLFAGTYTVTVSAFGYQPAVIADVELTTGMTTTLDVALDMATWYTVTGTVTDSATDWPLYAEIAIDGFPGDAIWTDPVTGYYSISLPEGVAYTFNVTAWVAGYTPAAVTVGPLTGDLTQDIALDADLGICVAPGYVLSYAYLEDFEADNGGYVVSGTPADHWQWGTPTVWPNSCASGVNCWGTNLAGNYANSAAAILTSPVISLTGETAPLTFNWSQAWHIESASWDHGYAEVSINGGAWVTMWEHTGATAQVNWTEMSYDISAAAGGNVQFRFRLTSDSSVNYPGYYVDSLSITGASGCAIPVDGGLVVGNVYDFETNAPIVGALVENEVGEAMITQATPADPAVDDAFYTLFAPSGAQVFTATMNLYGADTETVMVLDSDTVRQDFYLPVGNLTVDPTSLHATVDLGGTETLSFTLENIGSGPVDWAVIEQPGGFIPAPLNLMVAAPTQPRQVALGITSADSGAAIQAGPWLPNAIIQLVLDDGVSEDAIGLTAGGEFLWLNRFTPNSADFPFFLDQVSVIFRDSANVGDQIQIVIWEDTDGDGDPGTGANLLHTQDVVVEHNNGTTWNNYALSSPVTLLGPGGDVLIGLVNRSGAAGGSHPAAIDQTASQVRSWIGAYSAGVPNPPTLPTDDLWGIIDNLSADLAGNWMIRGSGMTGSPDVPWVSEDPISGTLAAGGTQIIEVIFDAGVSEVTQPGDYYAQLRVTNDTPYGALVIPITMTVNPPATHGKLEGTVTGLGYCDADPAPLEGAEVTVTDGLGGVWVVTTDAAGAYELWLDEAGTPFTVTVTYPVHTTGLETAVVIVGQESTVVDFDLRWLQPCVTADPVAFDVEVPINTQLTTTLTLLNTGAVGTDFEIREKDRGFIPTAGEDVLVVAWDATAATAMEAAIAANGLTYLRVTRDVFQATPVEELLEYGAVFYAGSTSGDAWAKAMAYLDAGGSFLIADNDFGYSNGTTVFYQQYLQSTYVSDAGSDGVLTGVDIMAGINPDISADPYPDDFTVGAEGVEIFVAPSTNSAGVRIERNDYRAIYLAWDFQHSGSDATAITAAALNFLVASDVLWISEDPITGTLAADTGSVLVDVVFDAAQVSEPGRYLAELQVRTDDPTSPLIIPVTMNVTVPGSGKVEGIVQGLGHCDLNPTPLAGAEVLIESSLGMTWTRTTDETGWYALWVEPSHAPLTVTVTAAGHESGIETDVQLVADEITEVDFDLRWLQPCGSVAPESLSVELMLGEEQTLPLTLGNLGAAEMTFEISEISGTVTLLSVNAEAPVVIGESRTAMQVETGVASGKPVIGVPSGGPAPQDIGAAWETMAPLPAGRVFAAVIADDQGYVYVIGGTSDGGALTPTNTNYRYDTATNTWDTMAAMPSAIDSIDGAFINGKIYIPGSATTADTFVYDIATDTWSTIAANGGYTPRSQHQVVVIDTDLYVLGGIVAAASASTTEVWVLDTVAGTWSAGVPMQKSRTSFSAAAIDGAIYVAGGVLFPGFTPDMTAEKFDGTAWSYIAGVPAGGGTYTRWSYNADGHGEGGLWLAGGRRDADWNVLNHAAYYDPETDTWTDSPTIPTLAQGRVYMEADVATDGYLYVIGGRDSAGSIAYANNERLYVGYAGAPPVDIPWLSQDPITGTVQPDGGLRVVDVTFTAIPTMTLGVHHATMVIKTNDALAGPGGRVNVPVTMTILPPVYNLTIAVDGDGAGDVNPGVGVHQFDHGEIVTVTATAHTGSVFTGWHGDIVTDTETLVLEMLGHMAITATFEMEEYTLTIVEVGDGTVVADPAQLTYHYGDVVTLTAQADSGWAFVEWSGDAMGTDEEIVITIMGNTVITATFEELVEPDLTIVKTVMPEANLNLGGMVTYTIILSNNGETDAAGVMLTDTLPAGVTFEAFVENADAAVYAAGAITWSGTLAASDSLTIVFTAMVSDDSMYANTAITNRVDFTSDAAGDGFAEATFQIKQYHTIYLPLVMREYTGGVAR